jgi:hypothetical protein
MSPIIPDHERAKVMDDRHDAVNPARNVKDILTEIFTRTPGNGSIIARIGENTVDTSGGNHGTVVIGPMAAPPAEPTLAERIFNAFRKGRQDAKESRKERDKSFTPQDRERLAREMREQADYLERRSS